MGNARQRFLDAEIPEGHEGPLRLCAVTRTPHPIDDLIRFVAGPTGEIVPDLARRLPGRGVWVCADAATVDTAVRTKVFSKSLKRQINAAQDLAGTVAAQLAGRAIAALSMANKAGLVTMGFAQVEAAIEKGNVAALVHGCDAAAGGRDKLDRKFTAISTASGREPVIVAELTIEQMSLAIGRANVVHAALNHGGATKKFVTEAGRLARYRPAALASAAS